MKFLSTFVLGLLIMTNQTQAETNTKEFEKATFAGGCFWCMQPPFDATTGVIDTKVGYMGGHTKNPTYSDVSSGNSGHAEVLEVLYDPRVVSYEKLIDIFWRNIDPTAKNRQFCDVGTQYRTAVFFHSDKQKEVALKTKIAAEVFTKKAVHTEIVPADTFYLAEEYHQDFYKKSPIRYQSYKLGCKRDQTLKSIWSGWKEN